ncbi:MAG: cellulase family glycosylhydrolase [Acidobacteriia bacterium]|nr:cellulase family glycosylhydrolase [Terriglobia bacterium]
MKMTKYRAGFVSLLPFVLATLHGQGYLHTSGNQIVDSNSQTFRIAGINWYGFETTDEVAHGLWAQDYHTILNSIKSNGYNVIRIPLSNQMVETPIIPSNINYGNGMNSDLKGLNSLQILDKIVNGAGALGLRVILDNHRSNAGNSAQESGSWYTSAYPETNWINDWVTLTNRYLNNPTVIGMDLRNEPHSSVCWGCGSLSSDWRLAAQRAGNAVLNVNSNLLIFVEGIDCYNGDCDWWGGNLEGAQNFPVTLSVANRLVYSAHDYGPDLYRQNWFNGGTTSSSLVTTWTKYWAYLSLNHIAPVWVGEFGTTNNNIDVQDTTPGSQGQWFSSLVSFLQQNPAIQWTYWALNGEDSFALLDSNYDPTPANSLKQKLLAGIQSSGGSTPPPACTTLPSIPSSLTANASGSTQINLSWTAVPPPSNCSVTYNVYSSTTSGFTVSASNRIASGVSGTTFAAQGLQAASTHYYRVTASDAAGESFASNQAGTTTSGPTCTVAPGTPGNLTALAISSTQINLQWNGTTTPSGCSVAYNVYASTTPGFTPSSSNRVAQVTGTSTSVTGLTASTTYYFIARSEDQAGESSNSNQASAKTQGVATGGGGCHITYTVYSQWTGGFNVGISIRNNGSTAINGWSLTWTWPGTQGLAGVWNASGSQQGQKVTFANAPWNPQIPAGGTASGIGFNGTFTGSNPSPTSFFLNGVPCN